MDYITQIRYSINIDDDSNVLQIEMVNLHQSQPTAECWMLIPRHYDRYAQSLLWKYCLYITLFNNFNHQHNQKRYKKFWSKLFKYIVFLDNVVEVFIHPYLGIPKDEIGNYQCRNFKEYNITEFLLRFHDPQSIKLFHSRCLKNIEQMALKHFEEIAGLKYNYDIDSVPDEDWEVIWAMVEGWYSKPIDIQWITSWVQWEDDSGNIVGHWTSADN
ncbi:hypothetical protein EDD15DRAFT_2471518 [Pisolithus albus]|nr:hypothetical protein EDD15DRAFT_2471518 [Pisolithus albus]